MSRPLVIDAQVHVWKASTPQRPWPSDAIEPQRETPLEIAELDSRMSDAGVDAALLLGPTWEGSRNDYVLAAAAAQPTRFGALFRFDTADPAAVELLPAARAQGMLGVRMSLNRGDVDGVVAAARVSGFFQAAAEHDVPLSIYAPRRYGLYAWLATEYPALKITVDHAAIDSGDRPLVDAIEPLLDLAEHPGIAVKASALPCFVAEAHPFPSIAEAVYRLVDAFGAHRVFWGSDLSRLQVPYEQLVDSFVNHLPRLDDSERRLVLGVALARWLNWTAVLPADQSHQDGDNDMEEA